jgi:hypothetical protein
MCNFNLQEVVAAAFYSLFRGFKFRHSSWFADSCACTDALCGREVIHSSLRLLVPSASPDISPACWSACWWLWLSLKLQQRKHCTVLSSVAARVAWAARAPRLGDAFAAQPGKSVRESTCGSARLPAQLCVRAGLALCACWHSDPQVIS